MKKYIPLIVVMAAILFVSGCVDVEQEIYMNHDGSGKIVEKVSLTPRGVRLVEGQKKRTGQGGSPVLLTDEVFQARLKALGDVTLASKEEVSLPDGRKQIKATYTFKDLNKVKFWIAPTLSYKKLERGGKLEGALYLKYNPKFDSWGKTYREQVTVEPAYQWPPQPVVSPAERQKFLRVLPVYQDMLNEFNLSIVMIAPIEDFEENDMKWNLPIDKNRVTIYKVTGESFVQSSEMIRQLIMNEVHGVNHEGMPGCFTPIAGIHNGRGVRFMKSTPIGK
ncbi:MAG: hypothetical protein C0404_11575 [Verrucomicrobia bacterium]|nr:hypothetical protein [Verrucomicrobiota bacterium]